VLAPAPACSFMRLMASSVRATIACARGRQQLPVEGQFHMPAYRSNSRVPSSLFQAAYLSAERGLVECHGVRRPAEAAGFGDPPGRI